MPKRIRYMAVLIMIMTILSCSNALAYGASEQTKVELYTLYPKVGLYPIGETSLREQIENCIYTLATEGDIEPWQASIIYDISGIKPIYVNKSPNVTIEKMAFGYPADGTNYMRRLLKCDRYQSVKLDRPSENFLPDIIYSMCMDLGIKMQVGREIILEASADISLQEKDISALSFLYIVGVQQSGSVDVTELINTYLRVIDTITENEIDVPAYIDTLGNLVVDDSVRMAMGYEVHYRIRQMFNIMLTRYSEWGIEEQIEEASVSDEELTDNDIEFEYLEFSRQNMIATAMSAMGKVRYVWGGGHLSTSMIIGISPLWKPWFTVYAKNEDNSDKCIRPRYSWCAIHGALENTDNSCAFDDTSVSDVRDFLRVRRWQLMEKGIGDIYFGITLEELMKTFHGDLTTSVWDPNGGVSLHRLDGLDCSGYVSWILNQVDSTHRRDYLANTFVGSSGIREVEVGKRIDTDEETGDITTTVLSVPSLLPGDICDWNTHVIMCLGKWARNTYIIIESAPNAVKLGVGYFSGGGDVSGAIEFAREVNSTFFGLEEENVSVYAFTGMIGEEKSNLQFGRLSRKFIDQGVKIQEYNKSFEELNAKDIVNLILNK